MTYRPDGGGKGRFNAQEYVDAYLTEGKYPRIHDAIFNVAVAELPPGATVDLAASTGLLGRRWKDFTGEAVYAIERDADAIARGVYGDDYPVLQESVTPESVPTIMGWLQERAVVNVLARRCLCVISESCDLALLRDGWARIGVQSVLLEGQTQSSRSVHPYGHADRQAEALSPLYEVRASVGHVRYLARV